MMRIFAIHPETSRSMRHRTHYSDTPMACDCCGDLRSFESLGELGAVVLDAIGHLPPGDCCEGEREVTCPDCGATDSYQRAIICAECLDRPCCCTLEDVATDPDDSRKSKPHRAPQSTDKNTFTCPSCKIEYGDPLYHGPAGHAPPNLCMDCWANEWAHMEVRMLAGGDWSVLDSALWLVSCGLKQHQAADLLAIHRNTFARWIRRMRRNPHEIPEWLIARTASSAKGEIR